MAVYRNLALKFSLTSGDERTFSIPDPKATLTAQEATDAMASMVTAGAAFADPLTAALSAVVTVTDKTKLVDNE